METIGRNIRIKQGLRADLPVLRIGELGFATDDQSFWIGTSEGNILISDSNGTVIDDGSITIDKLAPELQNEINNFIVVNNLTSTSENNSLSANQGRVLKEYLDDHTKKHATLTELGHVYYGVVLATIGSQWEGTDAPYTQTVTVNGIKEGDSPFVTVSYSEELTTAIQERNAYRLVDSAIAMDNSIVFKCFDEAPTIPINIQVKVVR